MLKYKISLKGPVEINILLVKNHEFVKKVENKKYKFFYYIVIVMSHGNTSSENEFSVIKKVSEHDLKEKSLIDQQSYMTLLN